MVDQLLLRGEFFTAYTPYQPEIAQGTLQALFEWQTFVCLLTGLEVSNASMYDGASATAEAVLLATRVTGRDKVVVSAALHPEYRKVLATYLASTGDEIVTVPFGADGRTDLAALARAVDGRTAAVVVGYPNFFGVVDALPEAAAIARQAGALTVAVTAEAVSLGLLQAPGALGADVAVGTLPELRQPSASAARPRASWPSARSSSARCRAGSAGATVDKHGRRGFVLTLSTREQHIRREKATSNICTNAGLCALAATIHLSLLGQGRASPTWPGSTTPGGRQLRDAMRQGRRSARASPARSSTSRPSTSATPRRWWSGWPGRASPPASPLSRWYPDDPRTKGALLSVATELHTPELIELFAQSVRG